MRDPRRPHGKDRRVLQRNHPLTLRLRNATILTINARDDVIAGEVWIRDGRILSVGAPPPDAAPPETTIDLDGHLLLPGFIQTHIHLCQTLFRGMADDRPLLQWLRERIWPLEAAHDAKSIATAARLAAAEMMLGGTTAALTMETVHDTDAVFEALAPTGFRATVGKCLMDQRGEAPARLCESRQAALDESLALHRRWHGAAHGRLRTALAPRFALSCSRELLEDTAAAARSLGVRVHTHASEQREEIALVRAQTGLDNLAYFAEVGLANERLCAAHCVWVTEAEQQLMADRDVKAMHCPGSNLKLGSGVAPVVEMRARGIVVSLGADGAPCNNVLDMFQEMRLAATLQAMRAGPAQLAARDVVRMATMEGARTLGLEAEIGSIEPGKRADLIAVRTAGLHQQPPGDPFGLLVYACRPTDVALTVIDGRIVAREGELSWADWRSIAAEAAQAGATVRARAGV